MLPIVEFACYNNVKNINTIYTLFEFNCEYQAKISLKDKTNPYLKSYFTNELGIKLKELMKSYYYNLLHVLKPWKKIYNKGIKSYSNVSNKKVELNSKYIKIKSNQKLKHNFLVFFVFSI